MKIENPCENCIVKVMCIIPCDELNEYARKVTTSTNYDEWLKKYECRPRVLGLVKILNEKGSKQWQNLVKKKSKK